MPLTGKYDQVTGMLIAEMTLKAFYQWKDSFLLRCLYVWWLFQWITLSLVKQRHGLVNGSPMESDFA